MSRRELSRIVIASGVLWGAALSVVVASGAQQPPPRGARPDMSAFLPPGPGKALVAKECSTCHDLNGTIRFRGTKQKWEAIVLDMVGRGAPLMIEDADAITAYLSDVFGPNAPPFVDVNIATREDLLKLPGVTPPIADRTLEHRQQKGLFSSRDEFRTVAGFNETAFEKIKWYIRAQR